MTQYLEQAFPLVMSDGLNTLKAASLGSTLSVAGAVTLSSTLNVTGNVTFAGIVTGASAPVVLSALVGATVALTAAQSGSVLINRSTSGSPSWTLPTAAAGLQFTFYTANTTAGFTVTGGTIKCKTNAAGTALSGTTLTNTQGTAVVGDCITLVCDGTNWIGVAQTGIFACA